MQVNSEGVSASRVFLPADQSHPNLLQFFIAQFPHIEVKEWEDRFAQGLVLNAEGEALEASSAYQPNTHLIYFRRLAREPEIPFEEQILFQDEHILVADKPHFLPVTPSGLYLHQTLLNRLKKKTGIQTLSPDSSRTVGSESSHNDDSQQSQFVKTKGRARQDKSDATALQR